MIYLLYGVERLLIKKQLNLIIKKELGEGTSDLISKHDMEETSIQDAVEDALMPSLFSDKKIIICENCFFLTGIKKKAEFEHNVESLMEYITHQNPNTILIITVNHEKLDERKKIVKELKKNSNVFEAKKLKDNELLNMIVKIFKKDDFKISNEVASHLKERTNNTFDLVYQEIIKLKLYKEKEKVINKEDIDKLVVKTIDDNIFSLIEAVVDNNKEKMIEIYNELLKYNEEPIKIIVMLANQFRIMYQTKMLRKEGKSEKDIASHLGIHPYRIKLAYQKGINIHEKDLLKYLSGLADLDEGIKMGRINKKIGLEIFLLKI